jgi:hypothetical protein
MLEKYGTYEIWECGKCHSIVHRQIGEGLPTCECVREKLASGESVTIPAWYHRTDLEEKEPIEDQDHGRHA